MKKTILQAIAFSVIIHVLIFGFQIARGYYQTISYVPSITNAYENTYMLQNEVEFGYVYTPGGVGVLIITLLLGAVCFIVFKVLVARLFVKGK